MIEALINPADPPERQREKLLEIVQVLMRRVERATDDSGAAYAQFQRAAMLEDQVIARTLDLKAALAAAERANASRSRFVAAASHDLLQPLSAAKLFMASIGDDTVAPRAREALHKAQNALGQVEGILGALLDISRLESGPQAVSVGVVALDQVLGPLRDEFAAIACAKGLALRVMPCAARVMTDPPYLRRILQNLIGNAVRYTVTGRVLVGTRRQGATLRLEVHDTGPGIPEAEQGNIFKEFHRLNARASAAEGMGLGLAIVERACAALGHPLALHSQVGRGTTFTVGVPLAAGTAGAGRDARPVSAPPPAVNRIVALVENDADLRRALVLVLEGWGVSVIEAVSGEEALALIDEIGILPDCVLVDQRLGPGQSGLEFACALRQRHGAVATAILTADRDPSLRSACQAAGFALLLKPIDPVALRAAVAVAEMAAAAPLTTMV